MLRHYLLILILFSSLNLTAQNDLIYLSSSQDVYFAGDTIRCTLSHISSKTGESAVLLDYFNSDGEKIDNYYTRLGNSSTKKVAFITRRKAKSGWYYIKASTADGDIQSNTLRFFIVNKADNLLKIDEIDHDDAILIFTEGSYPLINGLPGNLYIKVAQKITAYSDLLVVLRNSKGNKLTEQHPDQDGFVRIKLTPDTKETYYVELEKAGEVISRKQIDSTLFAENGISLNLTYTGNHVVNIQISTLARTSLSVALKVIAYNKPIETLFLGPIREFSLDLANYPPGLLDISILDQNNNILLRRLVFNKRTQNEPLINSALNVASSVQRGDSIKLNLDLSKLDNQQLKIKSAVLSIQDQSQNLFSNSYTKSFSETNLHSLKYYFSELPQKIDTPGRTSKSLDKYFAINQYSSYQGRPTKNTPKVLAGENLILQGTLTDSNHVALPYTPMVLTIPADQDSFWWVNTDESGNFSFTDLIYNDNKNIYLTPIPGESLRSYIIKIKDPLGRKYYTGYRNFIALNSWLAINRSLELSKNIKNSYSNEKAHEEVPGAAIASKETKLIFNNVDYDIDLNEYELPEQMTKFINPIIPGVNVRKGKLRIFSTQYGRQFSKPPLILIDGIPFFKIDTLLSTDPVRFERVQVITTIGKLAPFGNLGNYGVLAFYTREGYEIIDNYPSLLNLNGYRDYELADIDESMAKDIITPFMPSSYVYNLYQADELSANISLGFRAPDITTTLNVKLLLITETGVLTINKTVHIEK